MEIIDILYVFHCTIWRFAVCIYCEIITAASQYPSLHILTKLLFGSWELKTFFSSFQISSLLTRHHCHIYLTWKKALKDKRVLMNLFGAGIDADREQTCRRRAGGEKVGQTGRARLTYTPHLVWNRQLMGSWSVIAQYELSSVRCDD